MGCIQCTNLEIAGLSVHTRNMLNADALLEESAYATSLLWVQLGTRAA